MVGQVAITSRRLLRQPGNAVTTWPTIVPGATRAAPVPAPRRAGGRLTERSLDSSTSTEPFHDATLREWRLALLRYVHRLTGSADLAEDIAQEALLRLLREDPAKLRSPRAWLFRVASNLVRDNARRAATAQRPVPIDVGPDDRPDVEYERAERIARVRAALDRLAPRDREILMMRESGFPYADIAVMAGVRTESVPTLVMRALERFRRAFEQQERADASA
jgi:RNA polymerase sigma-70 factor (ECF subfamily)